MCQWFCEKWFQGRCVRNILMKLLTSNLRRCFVCHRGLEFLKELWMSRKRFHQMFWLLFCWLPQIEILIYLMNQLIECFGIFCFAVHWHGYQITCWSSHKTLCNLFPNQRLLVYFAKLLSARHKNQQMSNCFAQGINKAEITFRFNQLRNSISANHILMQIWAKR